MKPLGYELMHDDRCITVFSAPNYCDQVLRVLLGPHFCACIFTYYLLSRNVLMHGFGLRHPVCRWATRARSSVSGRTLSPDSPLSKLYRILIFARWPTSPHHFPCLASDEVFFSAAAATSKEGHGHVAMVERHYVMSSEGGVP